MKTKVGTHRNVHSVLPRMRSMLLPHARNIINGIARSTWGDVVLWKHQPKTRRAKTQLRVGAVVVAGPSTVQSVNSVWKIVSMLQMCRLSARNYHQKSQELINGGHTLRKVRSFENAFSRLRCDSVALTRSFRCGEDRKKRIYTVNHAIEANRRQESGMSTFKKVNDPNHLRYDGCNFDLFLLLLR